MSSSSSVIHAQKSCFNNIDPTSIGSKLQDLSGVVFGSALGIGVFGALTGALSTALVTIGGVTIFTPLIAIVTGLGVLFIALFILGRVMEHLTAKNPEENIATAVKLN